MTERIARFNELTPSTLPFVEGRMEGHKKRKNYSIVGPGVAEDSQQSIKISKPHGYNLGAVSACLLYTSPSPRDGLLSRMPSSA